MVFVHVLIFNFQNGTNQNYSNNSNNWKRLIFDASLLEIMTTKVLVTKRKIDMLTGDGKLCRGE